MWLRGLLVLVLCLTAGIPDARAATVTAASCRNESGATHIQDAINSSAINDTIILPAGVCIITQGFTANGPRTFQGTGTLATTLIDGVPVASYATTGFFIWNTTSTGLHRWTNIKFDGRSGLAGPGNIWAFRWNGDSHNVRVDHSYFITDRTSTMVFRDDVWGVVDHNTLDVSSGAFFAYVIYNKYGGNANGCTLATVSNGCGDSSWASPLLRGGLDGMFFEDNTVLFQPTTCTTNNTSTPPSNCSAGYVVDAWGGSRVTWRFSQSTNGVVDVHGQDSAARTGGGLRTEAYRNRLTISGGFLSDGFIGIRSGTGAIWDNRIITTGDGFVGAPNKVVTFRAEGASCPGICGVPYLLCNGSNVHDGNTDGFGYRCKQQIGAGPGDLETPGAGDSGRYLNYTREPMYGWRNLVNGSKKSDGLSPNCFSPCDIAINRNGTANVVQEGRDLMTESGGNVTVYANLGARPACAAGTNGKFAWVIDQGSWNTADGVTVPDTFSNTPGEDGVLYKCVNPNWTVEYTPAQYPHPLVAGEVIGPPPSTSSGVINGGFRATGGFRFQ